MSEVRIAEFSGDRVYRYTLEIIWRENAGLVQFIGLNPSTADELKDDPTVRRCKGFAKSWGFGGIVMTNLFAFRSTDPEVMRCHPNPIGEEGQFGLPTYLEPLKNRNDFALYSTAARCDLTIACWGCHGAHLYRAAKVKLWMLPMHYLALTKGGFPQHPLYLKSDLKPQPYQ